MSAIDLLSDGRLTVGVGAGSSELDYQAVGIPYEERWPRFDESIRTLRALWNPPQTFSGDYYSTEDIDLSPPPAQNGGPPIWIGSWGSTIGLRRVAHLGDGWLTSGYNTTPERFEEGRNILETELRKSGENSDEFPNAIATMFFHVTEDDDKAIRLVRDRLAPVLNRPVDELAERLPIGTPDGCVAKVNAYQAAGVERMYLWPVEDNLDQIRKFHEQVVPKVSDATE